MNSSFGNGCDPLVKLLKTINKLTLCVIYAIPFPMLEGVGSGLAWSEGITKSQIGFTG